MQINMLLAARTYFYQIATRNSIGIIFTMLHNFSKNKNIFVKNYREKTVRESINKTNFFKLLQDALYCLPVYYLLGFSPLTIGFIVASEMVVGYFRPSTHLPTHEMFTLQYIIGYLTAAPIISAVGLTMFSMFFKNTVNNISQKISNLFNKPIQVGLNAVIHPIQACYDAKDTITSCATKFTSLFKRDYEKDFEILHSSYTSINILCQLQVDLGSQNVSEDIKKKIVDAAYNAGLSSKIKTAKNDENYKLKLSENEIEKWSTEYTKLKENQRSR